MTIPPRSPLYQQAMVVAQGQRHPVHLQFTGVGQGLVGGDVKAGSQPLFPLAQLVGVMIPQDVVQAEQGNGVAHAGETGRDRLTHPLGRAIGPHHPGMAPLQLQQFPIEAVVLPIRHDGGRHDVVGVAGLVQLLPQGLCPGLDLGKGDGGQLQGGGSFRLQSLRMRSMRQSLPTLTKVKSRGRTCFLSSELSLTVRVICPSWMRGRPDLRLR